MRETPCSGTIRLSPLGKLGVSGTTLSGKITLILLFYHSVSKENLFGQIELLFPDKIKPLVLVLKVFLQLFTLTIVENLFVRLKNVIS